MTAVAIVVVSPRLSRLPCCTSTNVESSSGCIPQPSGLVRIETDTIRKDRRNADTQDLRRMVPEAQVMINPAIGPWKKHTFPFIPP